MMKILNAYEGAGQFISTSQFFLAFFLTVLLIWVIALVAMFKARLLREDSKAVVPEYEPPQGISPVFARYLMVSGKQGGTAREVSIQGSQLLTLIDLYEDGLLKHLSSSDGSAVQYEINDNYKNMECAEEERIFLDRLVEKVGMSGILNEVYDRKGNKKRDGYEEISDLWFNFWHSDMRNLAFSRGYIKKGGVVGTFLSLFSASLTFGIFFGIFLSLIPVIGVFIAGLLILPVLVVFAIGYGISSVILGSVTLSFLTSSSVQVGIFIFAFLSWFAWFFAFGQTVSKIVFPLTPKGLELVRRLDGYKMYLNTVDKDRLSFSFNRANDFGINKTSFSWLGVFGMVKDNHWDQWYALVGWGRDKSTPHVLSDVTE